jgi:hypothetical protein
MTHDTYRIVMTAVVIAHIITTIFIILALT